MRPTVLLAEPIHEDGQRRLDRDAEVIRLAQPGLDALRKAVGEAEALIVRLLPVTAEAIERAPRLRVVGRHGVGIDNIAVEACTRRRVPVVYLPQANTNAVAEHTVALLLGLAKRLAFLDPATRAGRFGVRLEVQTVRLRGKRIGIVGMGSIGERLARICHAMEMEVIGFDPYISTERRAGWARWAPSLDALLQEADAVSLHLPLAAKTRHLTGARQPVLMQRHALLINTARGAIVDEGALVTALHRGQIGGAALDVYETEPVPPDSPLLRLPNVLLTPHVAAHTEETLRRMAILTAEEVLTVLGGKRRRWLANPEILASLFGEPVPQEHNQFKQGGGDNA